MLAAAEAGVLTLAMTNPIWVVKTRLCLQCDDRVKAGTGTGYAGMMDGLTKIYRTEGIRGLYRVCTPAMDGKRKTRPVCTTHFLTFLQGFVPGMFGVSHGALQFMTYEEMKNKYNQKRKRPIDAKLVTYRKLRSHLGTLARYLFTTCLIYFALLDDRRVFNVCRCFQADRRGSHLPVPGDPGPSAGPEPQLQGYLGLCEADLEVRTGVWVL